MGNKICRVWFIHLIGLSRMRATTMLSVWVLTIYWWLKIVFHCNIKSDWRISLTQCYERYKTEASTNTSYMMLSSSPSLYKITKVHKVLLFCAFVRKQTTILHIILYFKLLGVERRGPHRKIRGFTSSIVAI